MITAAQLRAARGLVDWTRNELAKAANVSPETVKNIEHGIFRPQEETAERIVKTFAAHGVEFTESEGVRLHKDTVTRFEGVEGFKRFMDDVYEEAKKSSEMNKKIALPGDRKSFCMSGLDDRFFSKHLGDYFVMHTKRMNELRHTFKMYILVKDRPHTLLPEEVQKDKGSSYREYRLSTSSDGGKVPFYVYADKLAILIFEDENNPRIVVISSEPVAQAYREQFNIIWQASESLTKGHAKSSV
jgi:DNA-binding XRE family transcriptional regulator